MGRNSQRWLLAGAVSAIALGAQAAPRLETVLKPVRDGAAEVAAIEVKAQLTGVEGRGARAVGAGDLCRGARRRRPGAGG
jgi:hypothetical protein